MNSTKGIMNSIVFITAKLPMFPHGAQVPSMMSVKRQATVISNAGMTSQIVNMMTTHILSLLLMLC